MKRASLKILYLITLFCAVPGVLLAQRPITHYMKDDGSQVKRQRDADYTRVFQKANRRDELFTLTEYYPDQQVKLTGQVTDVRSAPVFRGLVTTYYPDGQLQMEKIYAVQEVSGGSSTSFPDTLVRYLDASGNVLVADGDGFLREIGDGPDFEEGEYQNGLREGEWKGSFQEGKYTFTEQYKSGVLVSGITKDAEGNKYSYTELSIPPNYGTGTGNGVDRFRRVVSERFKVPAMSIQNRASGPIRVEFVIDEQGKARDFTVLEEPGYGEGQAVIQAILSAGNWSPGYQRGVIAPAQYVLPMSVNFY